MLIIKKLDALAATTFSLVINYLFLCSFSEHNEYGFFAVMQLIIFPLVYFCTYYVIKTYFNLILDIKKNKTLTYITATFLSSLLFAFSCALNPITIVLFASAGAFNSYLYMMYCSIYAFGTIFLGTSFYYIFFINKKEKTFYLFIGALLAVYCAIGTSQQIKLNAIKNGCNTNVEMNDKLKITCFSYATFFTLQEKYDFSYRILRHVKENNLLYNESYASEFAGIYRACNADESKCNVKDGVKLLFDNLIYCTSKGKIDCASSLLFSQNYLNIKIDKQLFLPYFDKYMFCQQKIFYNYGEYDLLTEICGKEKKNQ